MSLTAIGWTGTRVPFELFITRDIKTDGEVFLAAGAHPPGTVLPGFTFNPWIGCQRWSEACRRCYAQALVEGRMGYGNPDAREPARRLKVWGPPSTTRRPRTSAANWRRPLRWAKLAASLGVRLKVFCGSLCDVGECHPDAAALRPELFALVDATPELDWLLLTKRPATLAAEWPARWRAEAPRNVWAGSTVEHQKAADERVPHLLGINARVRWLSCEPLCGPLDLRVVPYAGASLDALTGHIAGPDDMTGDRLAWIVAGGESGAGHETMDLRWLLDLHRQCVDAGVAFFAKQDSGPLPGRQGRIPDGVWATKQWPEVTR